MQFSEQRGYTIGRGVARAALVQPYRLMHGDPSTRPLQIYTLDPSAPRDHGAVATVHVPYEPLKDGPTGALVAVVSHDRDRQHDADPIDLEDPRILIQNGRKPSPVDLGFHQQMVYAVSMLTYAAFRQALGRDIAWGFGDPEKQTTQSPLRILPYGMKNKNAWYDRQRGELCFGYYRATKTVAGRNLPNGQVYTSLSHDIIVHEMTHALLDGLRSRFDRPTGPDVWAFHEGFADLIAIFQRFSYEQLVQAAVRQAYQQWESGEVPLLTTIARQFGQTTRESADPRIRDFNMDTVRRAPKHYHEVGQEPHVLGSVLVAAVLNASVTVFQHKVQRFIRLATSGTGILPRGELPPDLHDLLTDNARKMASQFLNICVRAIDYCPPVDLNFGDFLRAVITADYDLVPDDPWGYREAWIDAFRKRSIYPDNVTTLAEDALRWQPPQIDIPAIPELSFANLSFEGEPGRPATKTELYRQAHVLGKVVADPRWIEEFGCALPDDERLRGDTVDLPCIESIRTCQRTGPDGQVVYDLVAEVLQRRRVQKGGKARAFDFYGGATVILDPSGRIRYVIRKRITSATRVERHRAFLDTAIARRYWSHDEDAWSLRNFRCRE